MTNLKTCSLESILDLKPELPVSITIRADVWHMSITNWGSKKYPVPASVHFILDIDDIVAFPRAAEKQLSKNSNSLHSMDFSKTISSKIQ